MTDRKGNTVIKAFMCHGCQTCWEMIPGDPETGTYDQVIKHPHCLAQEDATEQAALYSGMLLGDQEAMGRRGQESGAA